ncbi:DUF3108 domain-containing protein [Catalinimonas alkaloidigena]|nr:DUF3108 domain-containing protein [Catalinimonas alkaloidigena]
MKLNVTVLSLLAAACILISTAAFTDRGQLRRLPNTSFQPGERLDYRVHYGIFDGGEATIETSPRVHLINDRPCYKIEVKGRTTGMVRIAYKVRDVWGSYVDTAAFVPHRFYRRIEENNYRKYETTYVDHFREEARIVDERKNEEKLMQIPKEVLDMVSGSFYMRLLDYENMKQGQTIKVSGIFEDHLYHLSIIYQGKEQIKTEFGKIKCIRLTPELPENSLFNGENAIDVYISDDQNHVPVKIRANMFVGALEIDLKEYRNLRHHSPF